MVRFLIPLAWFGLLVYLATSYYGYLVVPGSDDVGEHLITALLSAAPLLLVYLCLPLYLWGTRRLVARSAAADSSLEQRYRTVTRRTLVACGLGAATLVGLFFTGYQTQIGYWESPVGHHWISWGTFAAQVWAVSVLSRTVAGGERLLQEVGASEV